MLLFVISSWHKVGNLALILWGCTNWAYPITLIQVEILQPRDVKAQVSCYHCTKSICTNLTTAALLTSNVFLLFALYSSRLQAKQQQPLSCPEEAPQELQALDYLQTRKRRTAEVSNLSNLGSWMILKAFLCIWMGQSLLCQVTKWGRGSNSFSEL